MQLTPPKPVAQFKFRAAAPPSSISNSWFANDTIFPMRKFLLVAALAIATHAIEDSSPAEFQVVQRGDHNRADVKINGNATCNVEARVVSRSSALLPGLDWKLLGTVRSMYGYTRDAICNLEDALGMTVPMFGPLLIG